MTNNVNHRNLKKHAHSAVTLELLHVTPSQCVPQGSFDFFQLGGTFSQFNFKDWSTASAPRQFGQRKKKHLISITLK